MENFEQANLTTEPYPKPSRKKYILIAVAIIAVVGLSAGIFFVSSRYYSASKDGTPGWETYKSRTYNFLVEYPRDWNVLGEDPIYISPLAFQGYEVDRNKDFFGLVVEKFTDADAVSTIIDTEMRVYKRGHPEGTVEITYDRSGSSSKIEYGPYKKENKEILYESAIYWLIGDSLVLRVSYDYPVEERTIYKPIFEGMFNTFRFAGNPVNTLFDFSGNSEAYFRSQPRSGSLVPPDSPPDSQYRLAGSVYSDDYTQHIVYYCPNAESNLDDCSRINLIEDFNADYETEKNRLLAEGGLYEYMLERTFRFRSSEGVIVYAYNKDKSREDGPFEGWLYLNRSGHLLKIHSSHYSEFLSDPDNFINLLNTLKTAP